MADELIVVKRATLGPQHLRPGRTRHTLYDASGLRDFPPFIALEIAYAPSEKAYYLLHNCGEDLVADTWHPTLEEAMDQAAFEFDVKPAEWADVPPGPQGVLP